MDQISLPPSLLAALQAVNWRYVGLSFLLLPIGVIVLNVLQQLLWPRRRTDPPMVFHWLPWVGSAIQYGNDPVKFFFDCRDKHGDIFTFVLLGRKVTVALGAKGNNLVLGGRSTVFNAEDAYTHLTTPVFGHDVVYDVPNEKFMEQKKFVKTGLSTENLRAYVGMIEEEVEEFLQNDSSFGALQAKSDEWGSFDALKAMSEITILTASATLQGKEIRGSLDKTFSDIFSDLDGGFTPINFMFPNLPLDSYRKRDVAQQRMSKFYVDIIRKRRENPAYEGEHDVMAALLNQKYRSGAALKDHEIAHMLIALLMAGQHTSSATSSWAMLHLAANPDIAEALYREQVEHFSRPDGTLRSFSYEELRNLPILDSVIRETLRMHPPLHSLLRKVRDDVPVPASFAAPSEDEVYVVPKGHYVLASPLISQVDPRVWKDSFTWDPARWSDPEGVAANAYKTYNDENGEKIDFGFGAVSKGTESPYQPFGAGRHRCIGEQFAYLQVGTILSTMVRHLEMRLPAKIPDHNYHTMIVLPKDPRQIQYRRRK